MCQNHDPKNFGAIKIREKLVEEIQEKLAALGVEKSTDQILNSRSMVALDQHGVITALGEAVGTDKMDIYQFRPELSRKKKTEAESTLRSVIFRRETWKDKSIEKQNGEIPEKRYMFY